MCPSMAEFLTLDPCVCLRGFEVEHDPQFCYWAARVLSQTERSLHKCSSTNYLKTASHCRHSDWTKHQDSCFGWRNERHGEGRRNVGASCGLLLRCFTESPHAQSLRPDWTSPRRSWNWQCWACVDWNALVQSILVQDDAQFCIQSMRCVGRHEHLEGRVFFRITYANSSAKAKHLRMCICGGGSKG